MTKTTSETSMGTKSPMYIYATEMISEYYPLFNLKNKVILTICGSGDQVLNALFLGAKKVTGFDLNHYSKYILNLKISSILSLELKEFIEFFGGKKINVGFNYEIYKKLRENLDNSTKRFFDDLYKQFNFNGEDLAKSSYFRERVGVQERDVKVFNLYLKNEKAYLKMRKILRDQKQKFNFVRASVLNISSLIRDERYEIINLSNVQNYVCLNLNEEETVKCFYKKVLSPLYSLLKRNGIIFYYTRDENSYPNPARKIPPTLSKEKNIKLLCNFEKFEITQKIFKSFKKRHKDKIVILKKRLPAG